MKRSRFNEEQIIGILKQHQSGLGTKELCRKHGFSDATFFKWRSMYGGMDVSEAHRYRLRSTLAPVACVRQPHRLGQADDIATDDGGDIELESG